MASQAQSSITPVCELPRRVGVCVCRSRSAETEDMGQHSGAGHGILIAEVFGLGNSNVLMFAVDVRI